MKAIDKLLQLFPSTCCFYYFPFFRFVCFLRYIFFSILFPPFFFLRFPLLFQSGGMKLLRNSRFIKAIIRSCFVKLVYREIYYSEREREREREGGEWIAVSYYTISLMIKIYFCLKILSRTRIQSFSYPDNLSNLSIVYPFKCYFNTNITIVTSS